LTFLRIFANFGEILRKIIRRNLKIIKTDTQEKNSEFICGR
jgi:hypothetical protein